MNKLNKILDLMKKTGETCIITDSNSDEIYVIMTANRFSGMNGDVVKSNINSNTVTNTVVDNEVNKVNKVEVISELSEEGLLDKINNDVAKWKATNDSDGSII